MDELGFLFLAYAEYFGHSAKTPTRSASGFPSSPIILMCSIGSVPARRLDRKSAESIGFSEGRPRLLPVFSGRLIWELSVLSTFAEFLDWPDICGADMMSING